MLSGSTMMMFGDTGSKSTRWKRAAPYFFLSICLLLAILTGGRGPLFSVVAVYFVGRSIAQRKNASLGKASRILFLAGVGVIVMVGYRSVLHLGPQTSEAPSAEAAFDSVSGPSEYDKTHATASQEFVLHAAILYTVDQTGKLDYGMQWVEFLVLNPIPKLLWPQKTYPPYTGVTWSDIAEQTGIAINGGAAPGMVADLYMRFHLFTAIFMFALGAGFRRLFFYACNLSSPLATIGYVMAYALSLNVFTQGFGAIFVPFAYCMVPVVVFAWVSKRKARLRQTHLMLRQPAALHSEPW
jgi:hypothetical protein